MEEEKPMKIFHGSPVPINRQQEFIRFWLDNTDDWTTARRDLLGKGYRSFEKMAVLLEKIGKRELTAFELKDTFDFVVALGI